MKLRIALIMDAFIRVPPLHYGGIERVVADLANGLHRRGHEVSLWAAPGSAALCSVEPFGREARWTRWSKLRDLAAITTRLSLRASRLDVVHNFGRLAYLTAILRRDVAKVQTYMRAVNPRNVMRVERLRARRMRFTAVSAAIRDTGAGGGGHWTVVHNGAPLDQFHFSAAVDPESAPLVFLGRLDRCKGPHHAIAVARALGRRLVIAGTVSAAPEEVDYFRRRIEPEVDGRLVTYAGPLDNREKDRLLGAAAAVLMPVEFDEPFPVVLPEALLCGTPVVAMRRGGIPEGVEHGRTGFLCDTIGEMVDGVRRIGEIDRAVCRSEGERRFSDRAVVDAYERLYREAIGA